MHPDERIIRLVLKGRTDAFRDLMRRHQSAVFRLAYRILGRREDAEDAVQETFLRVYQSLNGYKEKGKFWPWVRRVAVNVCLKKLPSELPSEGVEELQDLERGLARPVEAEVLQQIELERVRKAIVGLPALYRTTFVLRYEEDLSYKEIADILEVPLTTVETRLHRAKRMLAERLTSEVQDEVP